MALSFYMSLLWSPCCCCPAGSLSKKLTEARSAFNAKVRALIFKVVCSSLKTLEKDSRLEDGTHTAQQQLWMSKAAEACEELHAKEIDALLTPVLSNTQKLVTDQIVALNHIRAENAQRITLYDVMGLKKPNSKHPARPTAVQWFKDVSTRACTLSIRICMTCADV